MPGARPWSSFGAAMQLHGHREHENIWAMKNAVIAMMLAPALGLVLTPAQPAFAQGGADSLYDVAPGQTLPDRDDRSDRDFDGNADDDDPEIEEMLRQLDRAGSGNRGNSGKPDLPRGGEREYEDEPEPDLYERDEPERDLDRQPPRDRDERRPPGYEEAKADLGHKVIAGLWTGMVEEVGQDPYKLSLSLGEDGRGTASYEKLGCSSEVFPIAGRLLEFRETITKGRDACADGIFRLRLHRGMLLWSWKDDDKSEFRAAATLRRSTDRADVGKKPAKDSDARDANADNKDAKTATVESGIKSAPDASNIVIQEPSIRRQSTD